MAANATAVPFQDLMLPSSVSGCAYPQHGADELALRRCADLRMYEAKRAGGNRYALSGMHPPTLK